jgi:hypothetical protein
MRFRRRIKLITVLLVCLAVVALPAAAAACGHAGGTGIEHSAAADGAAHADPHCGDTSKPAGTVQSCAHCFTACAVTGLTVADGGSVVLGTGSDWLASPQQFLSGAVPAPPRRPPRGA